MEIFHMKFIWKFHMEFIWKFHINTYIYIAIFTLFIYIVYLHSNVNKQTPACSPNNVNLQCYKYMY